MSSNPPRSIPRVFLVEDHPLMREVVRDYLTAVPGFEVCGEAVTAEEALERLGAAAPDLVLVDTTLPGMSGIELVARLQRDGNALACLVLSGHGEPEAVTRALAAGARGYVLKGNPGEIPGAIREVLAGRSYLSPSLQGQRGVPGRTAT